MVKLFVRVGERFVNIAHVSTVKAYYSPKDGRYHIVVTMQNPREYEAYEDVFDDYEAFAKKLAEFRIGVKEVFEEVSKAEEVSL
ncbi:MAG: hypothetical protein QW512_00455 [Thermofilaceae archaeon]